jgi:hypothetical protein
MARIETVPANETTEKYLQRTERDEMVTTCNGDRYSQAELRAAFSLVEDVANWKNPVDAWIHSSLWPVVQQAIIHFTGSVPTIPEMLVNGQVIPLATDLTRAITGFTYSARIRVKADGYYVAIGA